MSLKLRCVLGENGPVTVFTEDAPVACECCRREAVPKCADLPEAGVAARTKFLRWCLARVVRLIYRRPTLPPGWLCFAGGPLCPWGGCVSDLPGANLATRAVARYSVGCRLYRRGDCSLPGMPRSCDGTFACEAIARCSA
ncbi:hypothetical protein CDL15_Pgr020877 [Punica granatum]|uniref:Uncharacterized protein n=1 Tax=Punica granatum TaxID=22663 RepID=A0A218XVD0_PUNGR|nr:hypothetical protein CDL15_Pgr020877 [Punica granatum]